MSSPSQAVHYELDDCVAVLRLDDGKANALSKPVLEALHGALDRADSDQAKAIVLVGREGRFSAGFDLSVMNQGPEEALEMVMTGADFGLRLYRSAVPVVLGATGHALAMGAVLLLAADERIGAEGDYKIGLNEVAIGMSLPEFALALAEDRLSRRHLYRATTAAEIYTPETAVDAGYFDRVVPLAEVEKAARERAHAMASTLNPSAHRATKKALRAGTIARLEATIAEGRLGR
jgi:enoyl-CoA hydratase